VANAYPKNATFPAHVAVGNVSKLNALVRKIQTPGTFTHGLIIGDSEETFPGGSGLYRASACNLEAVLRVGVPTVSALIPPGTTYDNAGNKGHVQFNMRFADPTVQSGTAGYFSVAQGLPGMKWQGINSSNVFRGSVPANCECSPAGLAAYGGTCFDWTSGGNLKCTFEALIAGFTGTAGGITGSSEMTFQQMEHDYPRNIENTDPWNFGTGAPSSIAAPATVTGVAGLANGAMVFAKLGDVTVSAAGKVPWFNIYAPGGAKLMSILGVRVRHGTKAKSGMVWSLAGIGGKSIYEFFNSGSGTHTQAGPVIAAMVDDCDVFILDLAGWTNALFGLARSAASCGVDIQSALDVLIGGLTSAQRAKIIVIAETDNMRVSAGGDSAGFAELDELTGGLIDGMTTACNGYGVAGIVVNSVATLANVGYSTTGLGDNGSTATAYAAGTTYARGAKVYTTGADGLDYWMSAINGNVGNTPGLAGANSDKWIRYRAPLVSPGPDVVHQSAHGARLRAQALHNAIFSRARYTVSGSGLSMAASTYPEIALRSLSDELSI